MVGRALVHAAAQARDRHGGEQERDRRGDPLLAVEVVGRGGHRGVLAPAAGQRAQDRRRVHVARVVGHEDHRRATADEHLEALDPAMRVPGRDGSEEALQDRLARHANGSAARPGHVEPRDLTAPCARRARRLAHAPFRGLTPARPVRLRLRHGASTPRSQAGYRRWLLGAAAVGYDCRMADEHKHPPGADRVDDRDHPPSRRRPTRASARARTTSPTPQQETEVGDFAEGQEHPPRDRGRGGHRALQRGPGGRARDPREGGRGALQRGPGRRAGLDLISDPRSLTHA